MGEAVDRVGVCGVRGGAGPPNRIEQIGPIFPGAAVPIGLQGPGICTIVRLKTIWRASAPEVNDGVIINAQTSRTSCAKQ
jgi:hypothetical protein